MQTRTLLQLYALMIITVLIACGSSTAKIDLEPRDAVGRKIEHGLPDLPENTAPGMARIRGKILESSRNPQHIICLVEVLAAEAVSSYAPPLHAGKIIHVEIPAVVWRRFDDGDREQPSVNDELRLQLKYAGKPDDPRAATAWHLERLLR